MAIQTIRRLAELGSPSPSSRWPLDVAWMADVRAAVQVPVLADESVSSVQDAMALVRAGAGGRPLRLRGQGGRDQPGAQGAAVAEAAGLTCTVGSNLELGIGNAAMIHLAMATPGSGRRSSPATSSAPSSTRTTSWPGPCPSRGPGAPAGAPRAAELDPDKVQRYRVQS